MVCGGIASTRDHVLNNLDPVMWWYEVLDISYTIMQLLYTYMHVVSAACG